MLSRIDEIIYPTRCEVIELASQRYFYPIYKNGSSSIVIHSVENNCKTLINSQIHKCNTINLVVRDPEARFVSGVNTYVYNLLRDTPTLDRDTVMYFVENYLFLNRHYAPQISWLVNLSKYCSTDCKLNLQGMDSLYEYTTHNTTPLEEKILTNEEIERLKSNKHNQIYKQIDIYLVELIGKCLTFTEILEYIKSKDLVAYQKLKCIVPD